ncbi:hypothetical protein [Alcaligenes sp. WGS1538]|uniref:hypothetical protein n=1 Tax=Alcaligenes sp. WGS1538 TaxID=3366811 RepID=UPI00372D4927
MSIKKRLPSLIAEAVELHGATVAQQAAPYLFAACLYWWSVADPQAQVATEAPALWWHPLQVIFTSLPGWALVLSFLLGIWATIAHNRHLAVLKTETAKLQNEVNRLTISRNSMRAQLDEAEEHAEYLRATFSEAQAKNAMGFLRFHCEGIDNFGDHARASLYAHVDGQFVLAGRFTEHPVYMKPNRQRFPADQGCIGKAWLDGGDFTISFDEDHAQTPNEYLKIVTETCNIRESEIHTIRMKSRFYYARAVTHDRIRIGVVVYESLKSSLLDVEALRQHAIEHEPYLRDIINQACLVNPFTMMEAEK